MKIVIRKLGDVAVPATDADREKWEKFSDAEYVVDMRNMDQRTSQQNRALHKWCQQIANTLNREGLYLTGIFGNPIEWTMELVKTQIIKATIKKVFGIDSTTKLKHKEIDQLIDWVTVALGRKGVTVPPFPSRELWEGK